MFLCPDCGNKRCPRAAFHENACTNSNEPGQLGSDYPDVSLGPDDRLVVSWGGRAAHGVDANSANDGEYLTIKIPLADTETLVGPWVLPEVLEILEHVTEQCREQLEAQ